MDVTIEALLEIDEDGFKLLSDGTFCARKQDLKVIRLVVDEVDQVAVANCHRTFQNRTDDTVDANRSTI